jgi:hypothetical protein
MIEWERVSGSGGCQAGIEYGSVMSVLDRHRTSAKFTWCALFADKCLGAAIE